MHGQQQDLLFRFLCGWGVDRMGLFLFISASKGLLTALNEKFLQNEKKK